VDRLVEVLGPVDCTEDIVFLYFDGVSVSKSVALVFLATISIECP